MAGIHFWNGQPDISDAIVYNNLVVNSQHAVKSTGQEMVDGRCKGLAADPQINLPAGPEKLPFHPRELAQMSLWPSVVGFPVCGRSTNSRRQRRSRPVGKCRVPRRSIQHRAIRDTRCCADRRTAVMRAAAQT